MIEAATFEQAAGILEGELESLLEMRERSAAMAYAVAFWAGFLKTQVPDAAGALRVAAMAGAITMIDSEPERLVLLVPGDGMTELNDLGARMGLVDADL